jgi:hypothetical protein
MVAPVVSLRTTAPRWVMPLREPKDDQPPSALRPSPSTSCDPSTPLPVGCGVGRETGFTCVCLGAPALLPVAGSSVRPLARVERLQVAGATPRLAN